LLVEFSLQPIDEMIETVAKQCMIL